MCFGTGSTRAAKQAGGPDTYAPAQLRLRLLGDFVLMCGEEVISINSTRIQLLLAYLALHRDAEQTRQQLAFLFWPSHPKLKLATTCVNSYTSFGSCGQQRTGG